MSYSYIEYVKEYKYTEKLDINRTIEVFTIFIADVSAKPFFSKDIECKQCQNKTN